MTVYLTINPNATIGSLEREIIDFETGNVTRNQINDRLIPPDHILGRLCEAVHIVTGIIRIITEIARAIFASILAGLFCGQSDVLNQAVILSWKFVGHHGEVLVNSVRGLFDLTGCQLKKCAILAKMMRDELIHTTPCEKVVDKVAQTIFSLGNIGFNSVNSVLSLSDAAGYGLFFGLSMGQSEMLKGWAQVHFNFSKEHLKQIKRDFDKVGE